MTALWRLNTPGRFWQSAVDIPPEAWRAARPILGVPETADLDTLLGLTLGEGQFGPDHWRLGGAKRWYYRLKPLLPRPVTRVLRQAYGAARQGAFPLGWPVEDRYARFLWDVMRRALIASGQASTTYTRFWPHGARFALVLTHDIETAGGQRFVPRVADLEEAHGFRSSFNFVPERYPIDRALMDDLRARGFEIGVHGLKHDGKLFHSRALFTRRAERINHYLREWGAVGFRAPLTMRHPDWMQALEIEYDLSFFDTDPYEPIPGGTLSIWPFLLGRFVELPYTLVQDYTLTAILKHTTPQVWLDKVDFIAHYAGMVLVNTHPDYLRDRGTWAVYAGFLGAMQARGDWWHALPREVARWWRKRAEYAPGDDLPGAVAGRIELENGGIRLC
jgi:hypothetical protein